MSEEGKIPESNALAEADLTGLSELMSRDPEGFSQQDRARIISALRADRARREKADSDAAASGKTRGKASGPGKEAVVPVSAESIGL